MGYFSVLQHQEHSKQRLINSVEKRLLKEVALDLSQKSLPLLHLLISNVLKDTNHLYPIKKTDPGDKTHQFLIFQYTEIRE